MRHPNKQPQKMLAHDAEISALELSADGKLLISGDKSGIVRISFLKDNNRPYLEMKPFPKDIDILKISDDSKWLAISATDEAPHVISLDKQIVSSALKDVAGRMLTKDEKTRFGIK